VPNSDVTFLAIGTQSSDDGSIKHIALEAVAEAMSEALAEKSKYHFIAIKSTVTLPSVGDSLKPAISEWINGNDAIEGTDYVIVVTNYGEFAALNEEFNAMATSIRRRRIVQRRGPVKGELSNYTSSPPGLWLRVEPFVTSASLTSRRSSPTEYAPGYATVTAK